MKLGIAVEEVEAIPSGSLGVDLALGVNGYLRKNHRNLRTRIVR